MDGIMTRVVGEVQRDAGPRPHCTTDMDALRAVSEAHGARMARQAAGIAAAAVVDPAMARMRADAAAREAETYHRRVVARRVFMSDRIQGLRDAGRITFAQHRAAEEISDLIAWMEAGRVVMARSQFSERLAASSGGVPMQHLLAEAERQRFEPWRRWARDFPVTDMRTLEDLVRAFVVQRLGYRQLANTFRMDQRRAEALIVRALSRYAAIAGWEAAKDA
jgi:hypothetical protein